MLKLLDSDENGLNHTKKTQNWIILTIEAILSIKIGQNLRICMPFHISTHWCNSLCTGIHYGDSGTMTFLGTFNRYYVHTHNLDVLCVT